MSTTPAAALLRHIRQLATACDCDPRSDRELLRRFTEQRDEAAFATLLRRHGSMVLNTCRRILHQEADIEDAFQATFLVLLRQANRRSWRESLGGWLHGIAVRVALRMRAQTPRRAAASVSVEKSSQADPLASLSARELFAVLDEELARLPLKYREPLVLCHLQGRTQEETARQLGCSLRTIRRRLQTGRELLHRRLSRRGVVLPAALGALLLTEGSTTASVPLSLLSATVQAAMNGAISARWNALIDGVVKTAVWTPRKTAMALLLAVSVLAAGTGLGMRYLAPEKPPVETEFRVDLSANLKGDKKDHVDLYGDPLPPGALLRLGTARFRHRDLLSSLAYSPDGKILAAGGHDGCILFYDPATGRILRQFKVLHFQSPALAFSPDGKSLATASAGGVQIWDTTTGKELHRLRYDVRGEFTAGFTEIIAPAFSPDGRYLASDLPGHSIHIWDTKTGKEIRILSGRLYPIRCLAFSPDGTKLLSASEGGWKDGKAGIWEGREVRIWDVGQGKELRRLPLGINPGWGEPRPLCFSPDGKTLLCAIAERKKGKKTNFFGYTDQIISFLDLETGKLSDKLELQEERVRTAVFSRDGKTLATMSADGTLRAHTYAAEGVYHIKLWDVSTRKHLCDLPLFAERFGWASNVAFAPDGRQLAAAGGGSALHVWDLHPGRTPGENTEAHQDIIQRVRFSPDGRTLATASSDHTIALWDAATGRHRFRLRGQEGVIGELAFSPDGKRLASASNYFDQTVRLWNTATGKELLRYDVPAMKIEDHNFERVTTYISFASDGQRLAVGGNDRRLRLVDAASGKEIRNQIVRGFRASPNAKPRKPNRWPQGIRNIVFTPDGRIMALCTGDKSLGIVDVASGQLLFQHPTADIPTVLAISPDGKTMLYSSGKSIRLMEAASAAELWKVDLPDEVRAAAFAPNGRSLAVGIGDKICRIYLFNVPSGKELLRLQGHESQVRSLDFSPDGTRLASAQWDSTALVWDVSATRRKLVHQGLAPPELDRLWTDLADKDARKAHAALWTLAAAPEQAVSFLRDHLHPVPRIEAERLRRLIADLDEDNFKQRQEASRQLAQRGMEVEPALRQALRQKPSLELRRRAEALLQNLACQTEMTPDALRHLRAIQVLEQVGSPEARRILQTLAEGASAAPATRDAAAALRRMRQKR